MTTSRSYKEWSWLLLTIPIYLFIFLKLDSFPVRLWDESYFAVHATEMMMHNSWLVPYFDGSPINLGTKPPLQSWIQILFLKTLGINELALRLPSAIAAALSVLMVFFFAKREFGTLAGWLGAGVLLTSGGFIHYHTGRGMEADALLAFTMLLQLLAFKRFLAKEDNASVVLLGSAIALSFLTKSVAGFLFVPGMAVYLMLYKRESIPKLFTMKGFYVALGIGLGIPVLYIALRESAHPGFLSFMFERHIGRYTEAMGYFKSNDHYIKTLTSARFVQWTSIALVAIYVALKDRYKEGNVQKLIAVMAISFLLVLNLSSTRYEHYLNPVLPLFALMIAYLGARVSNAMGDKQTMIMVALLLVLPSIRMFGKSQANYMESGHAKDEMSARYLWQASKSDKDIDGLKVMHKGFSGALIFYKHKLESQGQSIQITNWDIHPGDKVLASNSEMKAKIRTGYSVDTIDQLENAIVYYIKAKRNE